MKCIQLVLVLMCAFALVGCQTTARSDLGPDPVKKTDSGTKKGLKSVVRKTSAVSTNVVRETAMKVTEKLRSVCVLTSVSGANEAGKIAAPVVERTLDDELALNGLSVVGNLQEADIIIRGEVSYTDKTQRGDRIVVRGRATVSMFRTPMKSAVAANAKVGGIISNGSFEAKSEEAFSAEEALTKLGAAFCPDVRKWAKKACVKVAENIGVCEIRLAGLKSPNTVSEGYPTRFAANVNQLKGIYECRIQSDEKMPDKMAAIVVYEKRLFPDGVLSRLREKKIIKD